MAEQELEQELEQGGGEEPTAEELQEARGMGWVPEEEWRGDKSLYLGAKEFLERGRGLMPVLAANNRRLKAEQEADKQRLAQLEQQNRVLAAAVNALQDGAAEDAEATRKATVAELKTKIAEASRSGDYEAVAEATEQLAEIVVQPVEKKEPPPGPAAPSPALVQELKDWFDQNPEYRVPGSPKEMIAKGISDQLRGQGDRRVGAAFLNAVKEATEVYMDKHFGAGASASRVASGNGGSGRQNERAAAGKSYADLPADAKAYCEKFAARVVGQGKKFKDIAAWRKSYTAQYFEQDGA